MACVPEEVRRLAREINSIKRELRNATLLPQLGRSSLDDESINTYDSDGNLRARYGFQHDGTYTTAVLDGPVPPVPSAPSVEGGPGELSVTWDGTYVDDRRAPMDFHVVEVWAAEDDFSDRSEARLLGNFSNESGGDITVARPVGEWHVALVSKAQSGRRSAVSERAIAEVTSVVDQETIDELNDRLEDLPSVTWSPDAPTTADGDGKPDDAVWRQVDAETDAITGEWTWDESAGEWVARPIADDAIYSLDVGKLFASELGVDTLVAEEIWASKIAASKIDAEEINTQSLGADEGFIGVLNSAEIVGAVIKTAETGTRVELDSGHGIRIFNENDELVLSADADGNLALGSANSKVVMHPEGISLATARGRFVRDKSLPSSYDGGPISADQQRVAMVRANGNGIVIFDAYGESLELWGSNRTVSNVSLFDDRVWVTYESDHRVESFTLDGELKQSVTPISFYYRPILISNLDSRSVFITDNTSGDNVYIYNRDGSLYGRWETPGSAGNIVGLAAGKGDPGSVIAVASESRVTILNTNGEEVIHWDTDHENIELSYGDKIIAARQSKSDGSAIITFYDLDGAVITQWEGEELSDYYSVSSGDDERYYITTNSGGRIYLEIYTAPGAFIETATLNAKNGGFDAVSAVIDGTTEADVIEAREVSTEALYMETGAARTITPSSRTDNEDYPASLEIVRPAFTHGFNIFVDEDHRDLDLPDPPDGTTAWTGERDNLVEWLRVGDEWVRRTPQVFTGPEIFKTVESGLTISGNSRATAKADGTCNIYISVIGLSISSGTQGGTQIGIIRDELLPQFAIPMYGYYAYGSLQSYINSSGAMRLAWSSGSSSNQKYFLADYPLVEDD